MGLISIRDLKFGYDGSDELLFDGVSVGIDSKWKLALAGRNGRGKTTFFKLLQGQLQHEGVISGVPQLVTFPCNEINLDEEWKIRKELNLMKTDPDIVYRPIETLSGGERTKLMLASLFVDEDNYPLIDEPTNHLDSEGREALASYLASKDGFMIISHDRHFLDMCTDHTLMITKSGVELTSSVFSVWWDNNEKRLAGEENRNEQLRKEMSKIESAMKLNESWSSKAERSKNRAHASHKVQEDHFRRAYEGKKASKLMSLAKNLQNRNERKMEETKGLLKDLEKSEQLKISGSTHHNKTPIVIKDLVLKRCGLEVTTPLSLTVEQGDKIRIEGPNGCGKSTLLKYIAGEEKDEITGVGDVYIAPGLKLSFVSQDTERLQGKVNDIAAARGCDKTQLSTILVKMGLSKDLLYSDISTFSLGQKKFVAIALSLCEKADIFIWDEPLNFMDIYLREEIKRLVKNSDITLLFVEHDEAFSQEVADRSVVLPRF